MTQVPLDPVEQVVMLPQVYTQGITGLQRTGLEDQGVPMVLSPRAAAGTTSKGLLLAFVHARRKRLLLLHFACWQLLRLCTWVGDPGLLSLGSAPSVRAEQHAPAREPGSQVRL